MKKYIAFICTLAMLISLMPLSALPVRAEVPDSAAAPYQVGYARVDINPYVVEDDPSSGIMALPLRGYGDFWDRLSTELTDDSGDGIVDENDGLFATCIAISDENGNAILLYTIDMLGGDFGKKARPVIAQRINAALESGELTGLQQITEDRIQVSGTHTHSSIASSVYSSNGRTGTNSAGVDLGVVNENLGIWIERTLVDLGDAAIEALKDRADAKITKDQLSVRDATTPILQNKRLNSIRHYNTDVDGDEFVGGNGFNAVDKWDYQNPEDYRTPRGVDPKAVSQVDDNMYFLRFDFPGTEKLPVLMVGWRGHPSNNGGATDGRVSSDYVNSFCHALEYGCEVTFDTTNGFLTGWTLGTTRKYRAAFFQGTGGNVNVRSDELITYPGSAGDVVQYANEWLSAKVYPTGNEAESCTYGVVLAQLALECVTDGLNETEVENGDLRTMQMTYYAPWKTSSISALGYEAALAYNEANAIKTVGVPYQYTSPETGEIFLISSKYHASNLVNSWNLHLNAPKTGTDQLTLHAITLGDDVAFLTMPGEAFDYYTKDTSLTGDALFAPENNLWNDLVDDTTYGKPFVLGYCNAYEGYLPNETSFDYNKGSTKWANGSYETHTTPYERGTGESMVRLYDQMLTALVASDGDLSYTASCAHCGENQLWQPYTAQTTLTTGHYYLCTDVHTATIKISGGQTVCIDLKGNTLYGETRAITTLDSTKDILNIMDSSAEQTGTLQGCGALYGAARALYSGTISLATGDELNLYSGTLTAYQRTAYSVNRGGVLHIGGTFNMYGGKVTGGTASSFTGSYYSGGAVSATKNGYGGCIYNTGTCNFFGGTVTGGSVTTITGTVTEPDTGYVYSQEESPLEDRGSCVWSTAAAIVNLSGDAQVDHLRFADDDGLNIAGIYTGSAEVEFNSLTEMDDLTVVGTADVDADTGAASITFTDAPGKTAAVRGKELVVSDLPYAYETCEACGECQWVPMTSQDFETVGNENLAPGHYRLAENVSVKQLQLNRNDDHPGTFCFDLAGHTILGSTRAFLVYGDARLNVLDSVGSGFVEGQGTAAMLGGAIYVASGGQCHVYGGTVRHNTGRTEVISGGGAICTRGGDVYLHGGTLAGGTVTGRGAAVQISSADGVYGSFTATGGTVTAGHAEGSGSCIYMASGCSITIGGDAQIDQVSFDGTSAEILTVDGSYTGSVELQYNTSATLEEGTVIGAVSPAGDLAHATITISGDTCKRAGANGEALTIRMVHTYEAEITAPTCTDQGYTTYTCVCGDTYTADEVAALGHSYKTVTVDPTCTETGSTTHTCAACGDTKIETIPATGHSHDAVVTAPTCTDKGYTTYTCECGDSYIADEVEATGHAEKKLPGKAATCTEAGLTEGTVCTACGEMLVAQQTIPATGHHYETVVTEVTCTTEGYTTHTCSCGDSYTTDRIEAIGHSFDVTVVDPGCAIPGYHAHTCNRCSYSFYDHIIPAAGHCYETVTVDATCAKNGSVTNTCITCGDVTVELLPMISHSYEATVIEPTYSTSGYTIYTCSHCGHSYKDQITNPIGHNYSITVISATCTTSGYTLYTCTCGESYTDSEVAALGHSFENGTCTVCGEADPDYIKPVVIPTLTLKSPTLEFKDMITVNAFFTAENIDDVVEMGMITYKEKVDEWNVDTAAFVIPGTTFDENTGRYIAHSQGINAKYLGDTVYLACYAKLTDGSYVYTKLAPYSPVQYATNQLKNSTDMKLKQLCAAMLNYGAEAQLFFEHNMDALANASMTDEQKLLPEAYRADMVATVPAVDAAKQGIFANNKGFAKRYPSISFEGAFCINYFFTPNYTPVGDITLYYWNEADFAAADVLTKENASGTMPLVPDLNGEPRADIEGIAAKNLSAAVYVAAVYTDGTTEWTSGVLGYSIGAYCASQISKGADVAALAEATAVYGYHAKQYFG